MVHLWNFDNEIGALNDFTAMIAVSIRMRVRTISVCPIVSMGYKKCSTYAHRRTSLVGSHSGSCFRYRSTRNSASRSNHYILIMLSRYMVVIHSYLLSPPMIALPASLAHPLPQLDALFLL